LIGMPHLESLDWDFKDELSMSQRQRVNSSDADGIPHEGERTFYSYDASGKRVRKATQSSSGTLLKDRIYLSGFEILREYNAAGNVRLQWESLPLMDDTRRVALIETKTVDTSAAVGFTPAPVTRYQFDNHLGTASLELDSAGAIISYEEYYPYGATSYQAGRSVAEVSLKRYRYTGKERDEETGFTYHGARYYAPWLGRWTSCDPAQDRDAASPYSYVHNRPTTFHDPDGKLDVPSWIPGAAAANKWRDEFYEKHEYAIEYTKGFFRDTTLGVIPQLEQMGVLDKPADDLTAKRAQRDAEPAAFLVNILPAPGGGPGKGGPEPVLVGGGGAAARPAVRPLAPVAVGPPVLQAKAKEEEKAPAATGGSGSPSPEPKKEEKEPSTYILEGDLPKGKADKALANEVLERFRQIAEEEYTKLSEDPTRGGKVLTEAEMHGVADAMGPSPKGKLASFRILFGHALERLIAGRVAKDPLLSKHLDYVENVDQTRPGGSGDFKGKGALKDVEIDVTTIGQYGRKQAEGKHDRNYVVYPQQAKVP